MIRRVTISHHIRHLQKPEHFDFFIEDKDSLITFSLATDLDFRRDDERSVIRLENHRARYLSYEGEISGGRGSVAIVHRGFLSAAELDANRVRGRLLLNGILYAIEFSRQKENVWHMICKPPLREIEEGKCKCLALDLDGTIANTLPDIVDSLNETLAEFGAAMRAESDIVVNVGWGASKLIDAFFPAENREKALARFIELYSRNAVRKTTLYPGVRETISKLRCYKIVLTNKPENVTVNVMDALGILEEFDAVVSPETFGIRKPDARCMLLPLQFFGIRPSDCILVGDSDIDFETARNAGALFCSAGYGYGPFKMREKYNVCIDRFEDILEVL